MKYECQERIPPDVTGKTYYEGEVYDLSKDEVEKLTKAGHFGAKYEGQIVEARFIRIEDGGAKTAPAETGDQYEGLTKEVLLDLAASRKIEVRPAMKKDEIIAALRAQDAEK